jgi:hypothetical protein
MFCYFQLLKSTSKLIFYKDSIADKAEEVRSRVLEGKTCNWSFTEFCLYQPCILTEFQISPSNPGLDTLGLNFLPYQHCRKINKLL